MTLPATPSRAVPGDGRVIEVDVEPNALGRALGLLGDEWTLLLLRQELLGTTRFGDFRGELGISDAVLTARLARLTDHGLLARRAYQERPTRHEHVLTARGRATWPILLGIWDWERRWGERADLPVMVHRGCGAPFRPVTGCRSCSGPITLDEVGASWGPTGGWARSTPRDTTRRRSAASRARSADRFPATMAVLGDRWSSVLVAASLLGTRRFGEFQRRLGIPATMLAGRLDDLVRAEVFEVVPQDRRADWPDYRLTDRGLDFLPVVLALVQWAQTHGSEPGEGHAIDLAHLTCGRALVPRLHCDGCGEVLRADAVAVVAPSGG